MSTASEIMETIAPQYNTDPKKASFILLAKDRTSADFFGTNYEMAVALRASHMMTLRDIAEAGGGGGEIASKREGDLAISYHKSGSNDDDDLSSTSYGTQLQGLKRGSGVFIGVTGGNDVGY